MTADELEADLARLLREGLVRIDETFEEDVPRFQITRRGRSYVHEHDEGMEDDEAARIIATALHHDASWARPGG